MKLSFVFILLCFIFVTVIPLSTASYNVIDLCSLPEDSGPCEAAITRYFFNTKTAQCESFIYGGCQGNANNFASFRECDGVCGVCTLPNKPGPCEGSFTRYFFNTNTGICEQFIYGGCQGNGNNFETLDGCEERCGDVTCFLQRDPGPCDQNYPGYYYDVTTHQCEKFVYGGCLGNANNFDTLEHCKARCHGYGQ